MSADLHPATRIAKRRAKARERQQRRRNAVKAANTPNVRQVMEALATASAVAMRDRNAGGMIPMAELVGLTLARLRNKGFNGVATVDVVTATINRRSRIPIRRDNLSSVTPQPA